MSTRHSFQSSHAIAAYSACRRLWDTPILESTSFVALPTVGALVEGWLLVVPKRATTSFATLVPTFADELGEFLNEVASRVEANYGPVSLFEHGTFGQANAIGCGVDYAHLHIVPSCCDLILGSRAMAPDIQWTPVTSVQDLQQWRGACGGYWFVQQTYPWTPCFVGTRSEGAPISQLFRRVIANHLGCPERFDWRAESGASLITATVEKLSRCSVPA